MKNNLIKILIPIFCLLSFSGSSYADTEEDVVIITNVSYTASISKGASVETATMDGMTGTHSGLSTVFTLQTNGGDDHFDYIVKSYVDVGGEQVSAYGDDGRLLFVHTTNPPTTTAVENAKAGILPNKNVFAYPTEIPRSAFSSEFKTNYKDYGNCYAIFVNNIRSSSFSHVVSGTPCSNTYELGLDEAGSYRTTIEFTVVAK